jgi:hypothetical protein
MFGVNAYPGRTYPQLAERKNTDPDVGGRYGPAELPSRVLVKVPAPGPPPHRTFDGGGDPWGITGVSVPIRQRSGVVVVYSGTTPGTMDSADANPENNLFHDTIPWSRPFFPNQGPVSAFMNPTQQPSWSANRTVESDAPVSPIPISRHRIDNFTIRHQYGRDRQLFPLWGTRRPLSGMTVQGQRWAAQAKTVNPYFPRLTQYGLAGSYGQTTRTLATAPVNSPSGGGGFGAY